MVWSSPGGAEDIDDFLAGGHKAAEREKERRLSVLVDAGGEMA